MSGVERKREERERVLAIACRDGVRALREAPEELRSDYEIVMAAVSQNGGALQWAAPALRSDHEIVMAAVSKNGRALEWAEAELRCDREMVRAAISQNGDALEFAAAELRSDRKMVMEAVSKKGNALQFASTDLRSDREVVIAAVLDNRYALCYAGDELLEDEQLAVEARRHFYFFKITALSGRSCVVAASCETLFAMRFFGTDPAYILINDAGSKLGLEVSGDEILLYGADIVNSDQEVQHWPGSPTPGGAVVEYQLVRSKRSRAA